MNLSDTSNQFSFNVKLPRNHLLLDSAPNLGPLISQSEIGKFQN